MTSRNEKELEIRGEAEEAKLSEITEQREKLTRDCEGISGSELDSQLQQLRDEISLLQEKRRTLEINLGEKRIIGLTLDGFIGRSPSQGFNVDWVVIDEAAYAPLVKVLPLLSLKCPISLFGDHRQLPPVCEADDNDAKSQAYWGRSVLYLESVWSHPLDFDAIARLGQPPFSELVKSDLTDSYRFDDGLASVLHRFVYKAMPLVGISADKTSILVMEVPPERNAEPRRVNLSEVDAVCSLVRGISLEEGETMVVLTPYVDQMKAINHALLKAQLSYKTEVLNTHKAQGKEWDVVVFSAVDGSMQEARPYFTNSSIDIGVLVLNTTISRVKRRLYLVLDGGYWRNRHDQLLGALVSIAESVDHDTV